MPAKLGLSKKATYVYILLNLLPISLFQLISFNKNPNLVHSTISKVSSSMFNVFEKNDFKDPTSVT